MSNGKPKSEKEKQKSIFCAQLLKALFCAYYFKLFHVFIILMKYRL